MIYNHVDDILISSDRNNLFDFLINRPKWWYEIRVGSEFQTIPESSV